jgi:predicted nucleic-acid-binding protein
MQILDANAILRYILDDVKEQADVVEEALRQSDTYIPPEVIAEVIYVFTGYYAATREEAVAAIVSVLDEAGIVEDNIRLALNAYKSTNLDFVDCMIFAYSKTHEILTFDKKLKKLIESGL